MPGPYCAVTLKQEQKPSIMSTTSKSKTMTEGPLAKQILLVSLPLALSNLLQILFNMSDVAVVGRFAGSTALGSVGSTATFVTLFTGFLIGLSNGVNVLVARFYGAGHPKDVSKTVHSALLVSLAAGVLLARRAAQTAWADIGPSGTQAAAPAAKAARVEVWNDRLPRRPQ